ncbi:MAG: hypothetical protein K0U78_11230 [Actinomycetia bacterium]|nr:hypothetical protein [Actinomycetes bacterium]
MARHQPAGTFEEYWEHSGQAYEAEVIAAGGTPWPLHPEKRSRIARPDPTQLRRALYERRHQGAMTP